MKIIGGFCKQYKLLSILTLISFVLALAYIFAPDISEIFPYADGIFTLINTLGLAIIANWIFCFFQVYIPSYQEAQKVEKSKEMAIKKILIAMAEPYEKIYTLKTKTNISFEKISSKDLKSLLDKINLQEPLGFKGIGPNGSIIDPPAYWIIYQFLLKTREEIERTINLLGKYLDSNLLSLLLEIHGCSYFSWVTRLHNSGVWDKLSDFGPTDGLLSLQHLYCRLKNIRTI